MRLALIVEYEGTNYHGFQYQNNARTVQDELERAIQRFTGERVRVKGAGRTDAGVHAEGQVVAFDTDSGHPLERFEGALNFYLPDEISVRAAYRVAGDFDPRRGASSRRYRYTILNSLTRSPLVRRMSHLVSERLDVRRMQEGAKLMVGSHDFTRFAGPLEDAGASTVRQVKEAVAGRSGSTVTFEVEANAFLPHQVRRMAGALLDVGRGSISIDELSGMLNGDSNGRVAHALPAHGLCLVRVSYPNFPPSEGEVDGDEH